MYSFGRDSYSSSIFTNTLEQVSNNLNITDFNFMPFIEIRSRNTWTKQQFDVFDESKWNWGQQDLWNDLLPLSYKKLSKYIKI